MHGETMSGGYFLYHAIGQYPGKARDMSNAMAEFASAWSAGNGSQWDYVLGQRQNFIERWRAIIEAPSGSVTTCENVTQGLHMLVTALPPHMLKGKRILVAGDCFPSNHFLLSGLQERLGFTLDTVLLRQGASWVEDDDMIARWDSDVELALLTWVSSTSSHRIDLDALVAHGRAQGSLIGIDITQAAGLLPYSVNAPAVDFTISTSLKWMCGTPGAGILHVTPDLIAKCQPELRGWFSQDNPFNWALDKFALAPDIRRFDNGTPGVVAAIASLPALDWHAGQDQREFVRHNRALTAQLIAAIDALGLTLITPRPEAKRGGSLMLRLPETFPAATVIADLQADDLHVDARGQILRLSPGVMTTGDGCESLIAALARIMQRL